MNTESLISEEAATAQINLLESFYELEMDEDSHMGEGIYNINKKQLIKHVMRGRLEISLGDDGILVEQIIQTKEGEQRLEYKEIGGFAKLQIDKVKGQIEAVYTIAGAMTGKGMSYISKLKGKNLKVAENLANFLFE